MCETEREPMYLAVKDTPALTSSSLCTDAALCCGAALDASPRLLSESVEGCEAMADLPAALALASAATGGAAAAAATATALPAGDGFVLR